MTRFFRERTFPTPLTFGGIKGMRKNGGRKAASGRKT
jgi:hypothetical protein